MSRIPSRQKSRTRLYVEHYPPVPNSDAVIHARRGSGVHKGKQGCPCCSSKHIAVMIITWPINRVNAIARGINKDLLLICTA